jgi:hypothetical protein
MSGPSRREARNREANFSHSGIIDERKKARRVVVFFFRDFERETLALAKSVW